MRGWDYSGMALKDFTASGDWDTKLGIYGFLTVEEYQC
jgi:hypothetical protein